MRGSADMGYHTRYKLHCLPSQHPDFYEELTLDGTAVGPYEEGDTLFDGECKWYDHDHEMRRLSVENPRIVFILDGEGEDAGDIWRTFYKGGRSYTWRPDVEPPAFEYDKLI